MQSSWIIRGIPSHQNRHQQPQNPPNTKKPSSRCGWRDCLEGMDRGCPSIRTPDNQNQPTNHQG